MCTVSWASRDDGYVLFFNRDELKTRMPASGPVKGERSGVRFLAPIDGDQGGSWLLVNELGLTLGLLNHYPREIQTEATNRPSRGRLVMDCADLETPGQVADRLGRWDLGRYLPFRLLGLNRKSAILLTWDGADLQSTRGRDLHPPLTSSSYRPDEVSRFRIRQYQLQVEPDPDPLGSMQRYHHQHDPSMSAQSVMMNRHDACTHSFCRIEVGMTEARLRYEPQAWFQQGARASDCRLQLRP